jgi:hypothetical protein
MVKHLSKDNRCGAGGMNPHIPPRVPHPRRRVRHKHAMRVLTDARKASQRWLDKHDRCARTVARTVPS